MKCVSMMTRPLLVVVLTLAVLLAANEAAAKRRGILTGVSGLGGYCSSCPNACDFTDTAGAEMAYNSPMAFLIAQGGSFSYNLQTAGMCNGYASDTGYIAKLGLLPTGQSCPDVTRVKSGTTNGTHGYYRSMRQSVSSPDNGNVDWTSTGCVQPPMDQGGCSSCYAMAAAAHFEDYSWRKTARCQALSYQQMMDCSSTNTAQGQTYGNGACQTGWHVYSLWWVQDRGQMALLQPSTAYLGQNGPDVCYQGYQGQFSPAITVGNPVRVTAGSESALTTAIASQTVVVSVNAGTLWWQTYTAGILWDPYCATHQGIVNHAALAVGYGSSTFATNIMGQTTYQKLYFYKIKNSFGTGWGENGYIRLVRYGWNNCDVASYAYYLQQ